jgi:hypothetical protein
MGYSEKHCPVSVTLCRYSGFNSTKEEEEEAEGLEEGGGGLNLFILGTNERKFIAERSKNNQSSLERQDQRRMFLFLLIPAALDTKEVYATTI